ncbi:hypothetical protein ABPG75_006627 [Micractinium tetrahymenae]
MSGASQPGPQATWAPAEPTAAKIKMPPGPTVNLSAVSATLTAAGSGTPGGYSTASSPYARGSSTHSSPYNISRTGSGASDGSVGAAAAGTHPAELLQALGGGAGTGSRPGTPSSAGGAATPPRMAHTGGGAALSIEATLQGLAISGATSPAAPPTLTFTAPPSGAMPPLQPVEVFARFPQETSAGPSGRGSGGRGNGTARNSGGRGGAQHSGAQHSGGAGYGYAPGAMGGPPPHQGPPVGGFYVGSPPGSYAPPHMGPVPIYGPPPAGSAAGPGLPPGVPTTAGFPAATYYPQPMGPQGQQGGQPPHGAFIMHPYYGLVPQPYPQHYGVYTGPPAPGGAPGSKAAYEAAEYQARQYHAMMSYMQGFGMMVSPSGSPERMSRPGSAPSFRRGGVLDSGRGRPLGRPSRLSLDMSASKSENGDAHRLDPELAPLVAEDKTELQSDLLEEYKASREGHSWTLQDLRGHLYPFCRDQHGSRLVQQQLEAAEPELVLELFGEVRHKLLPLMVDVFGNYVVQRFLERGGEEVRGAVAEAVRGKVLPLALQMYGCRVVQKALEVLPMEERVSICQELTDHTLRCVRDQNGNHVVQKCIECVQPSDPARAMIETIVNKGQSLSGHTFGCRLVQRVLEFCSIPELRGRVITDVLGNALQLSHDQYGNYVVQHLVIKGPTDAREVIVGKVAPQVMTLAQHKYASNVVEACLKHGTQAHRDAILEQMIAEAVARPAALTALMRDQYGNYVVQRSLDVATPAQRVALLRSIQPHLEALRKYTYGKHIVAKVENMLAQQAQQEAAEAAAAAAAAAAAVGEGQQLPLPLPVPVGAGAEGQQVGM